MTLTDPLELAADERHPVLDLADASPVVDPAAARQALVDAAHRVAPLWPLTRFVAVNAYAGLADLPFATAADRLAEVAGIRSTLPAAHYLGLVDEGRIERQDLAIALAAHGLGDDVDALIAAARADSDEAGAWRATVPTVASVASDACGRDLEHLVHDRLSAWAAAYFDEGQASWRAAFDDASPYAAWRAEASIDRTPEVLGRRGVRKAVRSLPGDPIELASVAIGELGLAPDQVERYLHALAARAGGWLAHARRLEFENDLLGRPDDRAVEVLAIALAWELVLWRTDPDGSLPAAWAAALAAAPSTAAAAAAARRRLVVLQEAFDRAEQRRLVGALAQASAAAVPAGPARPAAQAVFCIDVRSEVFRRHLEATDPAIATIGFAGFFGFPVEVVPLAHGHGEGQHPVLLTAACAVPEVAGDEAASLDAADRRHRAHHRQRAWKSFKMGAISCFSFVGPVGLAYLPKLITDGLGRSRTVARPEEEALRAEQAAARRPDVTPIPLDQKVAMAAGALRAMSMREGLAPLVLIAGHGATTVNNPYDSGLDCGACGGHTGEANARIAVAILNDPEVRARLAADEGIAIPADTWFVAAQHDTTTDRIAIFDRDDVPASHHDGLATIEGSLARAGARAREERARRMARLDEGPVDADILRRSVDWSEVRPEWGLAGCRAFIVAPRERTASLDLGGRAFLHSYDWRQDEGFGVLELIMTAPMVVASWISLQYYASTVDNERLGAGNKVLHNVVGRIGVLEGNGGDLRVGLPWQSVHDGEGYQHEPLRLSVAIAAPTEAMDDVIGRHEHVRHLLDHGWLQLFALGDDGTIARREAGGRWEPVG